MVTSHDYFAAPDVTTFVVLRGLTGHKQEDTGCAEVRGAA
jgi:hypothetical protein